jgi:peptidoglycan/xylan/chitin deacetylase (PgdA/CDA1 family)
VAQNQIILSAIQSRVAGPAAPPAEPAAAPIRLASAGPVVTIPTRTDQVAVVAVVQPASAPSPAIVRPTASERPVAAVATASVPTQPALAVVPTPPAAAVHMVAATTSPARAAPPAPAASQASAPSPSPAPAAPATSGSVPAPVSAATAPSIAAASPPATALQPPVMLAQASPRPAAPTAAAAPPQAPPPAPAAAAPAPQVCPGNPNALGLARTVEINTAGGPGFGFEHFRQHDFLKPGEIVLTFDDGPWQTTTPSVLAALASHCTRATFFPIGKHATYYPDVLRSVADAGHTVGSHTWSHADLSKKTVDEAKAEIEMGISAVRMAVGDAAAPFFRFPALKHPGELVTYLGERNIAIFSTDLDSFDFRLRKGDQVVKSVIDRLKKHGKGIVLMHDFQHATAEGIATLLAQLKLNGYKVVHMRAKNPVASLPEYDEMVRKQQKLPTVSARPTSDVVRTVDQ